MAKTSSVPVNANQHQTFLKIASIKGDNPGKILDAFIQNYILENAAVLVDKINKLQHPEPAPAIEDK